MRYAFSISLVVLAIILFTSSTPAKQPAKVNSVLVADATSQELITDYFTITDEFGKIVLETGHLVQVGDEIINEDNELYEIISVEGNSAKAHKSQNPTAKLIIPASIAVQASLQQPSLLKKPFIAVYHTHTDENYIPNDGKATTPGNGSIIRVGDTFASSLRNLGYEVTHSTTLHDPHDANAYHRSRRTAMKLMKNYPVAMFDVHRDSAPLKNYQTVIDGRPASKILLVVGKQNQNRQATQEFAQSIKAVADSAHPGLVRGIFIAKGNYNQDLSPRNILVEVGTQYSSLDSAQLSAALFANIMPSVLALNDRKGNFLEPSPLSPAGSGRQILPDSDSTSFVSSFSGKGYFIWAGLLVLGVGAGIYFYSRKKSTDN